MCPPRRTGPSNRKSPPGVVLGTCHRYCRVSAFPQLTTPSVSQVGWRRRWCAPKGTGSSGGRRSVDCLPPLARIFRGRVEVATEHIEPASTRRGTAATVAPWLWCEGPAGMCPPRRTDPLSRLSRHFVASWLSDDPSYPSPLRARSRGPPPEGRGRMESGPGAPPVGAPTRAAMGDGVCFFWGWS